ncbi:MAG TPA: BNR-4 repeat-containing protein [Tepidisphaeraceae bacterium]|nr:BNR-4 repeat-containing protein [Tepidisphaeraceae bacterium]
MAALSQQVVSLNGIWSTGADLRAVYDATSNRLFYGAIRSNGVVEINSWDFTRRIHLHGTPRTAVLEADDHNNPALCVLNDGIVLACYSQHNGDSYSARSSNARDIRTWGTPVQLASGTTDDTYASVYQVGDTNNTVYWFFRRYVSGTTYDRYFRTSTDGGASWNSPVQFLTLANQRPYLSVYQNGASRLDFLMTPGNPNEIASSIYHGYMTVAANGTRTYFKTDGTQVGVDADLPFEPADFTLVYDGTTTGAFMYDFAVIGGTLTVNYISHSSDGSVQTLYQARWNGSAWQSDEVTTGGTTATSDSMLASEIAYPGGMCQDPNNIDIVYASREYGAGDFRLEQWTHTGTFPSGSWSKTADVSGDTDSINARPYCPRGLSPTRVLWWEGRYTSYTDYFTKVRMDPAPDWRAEKATTPAWTSGYAPSGVQAYYLIHEGSGTSLTDLANGRNGTFVGSPTWNAGAADDFGAFLSGFSTSAHVTIDTLASVLNNNDSNYPVWAIVLLKTTSTGTTGQWPLGFGRSSNNNPLFGPILNNGAATTVAGHWRDDAAAGTLISGTVSSINDGEFHVVYVIKIGASDYRLRVDNLGVATTTTTTGAVTFDRGTIGCLRRSGAESAFAGEIHAVLVGWGAEPDAPSTALDLLQGQFRGTFDPDALGVSRLGLLGVG